jgi:4-aminobutyrate aminotransferase-like enzyme
MLSWRREPEVVHTSTFAGAPLAASTAIATLDVLHKAQLLERSASLGARYLEELRSALSRTPRARDVRGAGMMLGIDLGESPGAASHAMRGLLAQGYIATTGGGQREVLVLTPPLNIAEDVLFASVDVIAALVGKLG